MDNLFLSGFHTYERCFGMIIPLDTEIIQQFLFAFSCYDGYTYLDAVVDIPVHPIRRPHNKLCIGIGAKYEEPAVFQVPVHQPFDGNMAASRGLIGYKTAD